MSDISIYDKVIEVSLILLSDIDRASPAEVSEAVNKAIQAVESFHKKYNGLDKIEIIHDVSSRLEDR